RDAAVPADAPADPRHPERIDPIGPRRVRRAARARSGRRVRGAREFLQHRERSAVGRSLADGRAGGESRVRGGSAGGWRCNRESEGGTAVRESRDARTATGTWKGKWLGRTGAGRTSAPASGRRNALEPPIARPDGGPLAVAGDAWRTIRKAAGGHRS